MRSGDEEPQDLSACLRKNKLGLSEKTQDEHRNQQDCGHADQGTFPDATHLFCGLVRKKFCLRQDLHTIYSFVVSAQALLDIVGVERRCERGCSFWSDPGGRGDLARTLLQLVLGRICDGEQAPLAKRRV